MFDWTRPARAFDGLTNSSYSRWRWSLGSENHVLGLKNVSEACSNYVSFSLLHKQDPHLSSFEVEVPPTYVIRILDPYEEFIVLSQIFTSTSHYW